MYECNAECNIDHRLWIKHQFISHNLIERLACVLSGQPTWLAGCSPERLTDVVSMNQSEEQSIQPQHTPEALHLHVRTMLLCPSAGLMDRCTNFLKTHFAD